MDFDHIFYSNDDSGNDGNDQNTYGAGGRGATTPNTGAKPPTYGSHPRQCIVQPINVNLHATLCPKSKPETQRRHPKATKIMVVNWSGWHHNRHPSKPMLYPTFGDIYPKCNHGGSENASFSQNGSGHRGCHHRRPKLIWTWFLLVNVGRWVKCVRTIIFNFLIFL